MQRLEVSDAVRPLQWSLGVKGLRDVLWILTADAALHWSQHIQSPGKGSIPASHFPGAVSTALWATGWKPARRRGRFKQGQVQALQVTLIPLATGVRKGFEVSLCAYDATRVVVIVVILTLDRWLWSRRGGGIWVQIVPPGSTHFASIALRWAWHTQYLPFVCYRHGEHCIECYSTEAAC